MDRQLCEKNIKLVESFIQSHEPSKSDYPAISYRDQDNAIEYFNEISKEETPITSYYLFASNSMGMTSYGYYKSKEGKIFIIEAFMQEVVGYYNVDSDWYFLKY